MKSADRDLATLDIGTGPDTIEGLHRLLSGRTVGAFDPSPGSVPTRPGTRLEVRDSTDRPAGRVEVTDVRLLPFDRVSWGLAETEGGDDRDLADWRSRRIADWAARGIEVRHDTQVEWIRFRLLPPLAPMVERATALDLGLPDGYAHAYTGKVRDLFRTPDGNMLFLAGDRISAYDYVLPTPIPDKGRILTAMSLWWFERLSDLTPNHVVGTDVPPSVAGRAVVCVPLDMFGFECVVRGYLTGSGLVDYRATGRVCGLPLPSGLTDGSRLPEPVFTPATKAAVGEHDENVDFAAVVAGIGQAEAEHLRRVSLDVYARAEATARRRGIILADTKFEFGRRIDDGRIVLADEVLTPDSSRFWALDSWRPGRSQASFDKQYVRDWLVSPDSGWDRRSGTPPPPLPRSVVDRTRERYVEAYQRITGDRWR